MKGKEKEFGGGGQGSEPPAPSPKPSPPTPYRGLGGGVWGRAGDLRSTGPPLKTPAPAPLRLCVPVVEEVVSRARRQYLRAARKGCWSEIRLDYLERPDLKRLFRTLPGPVVVTNRPQAQGGRWAGSEADRLRLLDKALAWGVHFLDVELATEAAWRQELGGRRGKTRIILSWHDFSGTPELPRLEALLEEMLVADADILKIVTWAHQPEDNLRLLSLIPKANSQGRQIIAFCLGPVGKWSRMAAPFLGSYLTYAPFTRKGASAPGQLTVNEVRRIWRALK